MTRTEHCRPQPPHTGLAVTLSSHALTRMQQRGVRPELLAALLSDGSREHDHRGAVRVFFDQRARRRLARRVGADKYRNLERGLDAYAVVSVDGTVLTVGHRTRRLQRGG